MTTASKQRPTGVAILAGLYLVYGAFKAVGALAGIPVLFLMGPRGLLIYPVHGMVILLMVAFGLGEAALFVSVGVGLIKLQNWARVVSIASLGLVLVMGTRALAHSVAHAIADALVPQFIGVGTCVVLLRYLFAPHVKQAFGATKF